MPNRLLLIAAGALGGTVVLGGTALALTGSDVPRGVVVAGVDVGGVSAAEARGRLGAVLPRTTAPVRVVVDGEERTIDPVAAGLSVDLDATVDALTDTSPLDGLRGLFGARREVELRTDADDATLAAAVAALKKAVDRPAREGAVRFQGATPVAVLPLTGRVLDAEATASELRDEWVTGEPVEAAVEVTPVKSTAEGVQAALTSFARPAVAAPVTVDVEGKPLVVRPADIAKAFSLEADSEGNIAPTLKGDVLLKALDDRLAAVEQEPLDATFDVSSGTPVVVPGKDGKTVGADALEAALSTVLRSAAPRRTSLALVVTPPRVTTALAKTLGVKEKVGEFTTFHPCCRPRVTNIHRIADIVDGHVVLPGETYSLNGDVGERDRARGFVEAPQILEGQFVDRVGGGVSQFATTLYNATFFAGMQDVEHKPHSYFISRYPAGREATVSFPAPDLRWKNDSPHGAVIITRYTERSITVELWGTKRYDEIVSVSSPRTRMRTFGTQYVQRADCTAASGANGFDITITRIFKKGGVEVKRDSAKHRYLPEPRFICGPPPRRAAPAPSGSPSPSASPKPAPSASPTA
ncbi:MAG: VanW family protein [Mycobacteriales bacterium]|nr:VanW family protein [Mycobacteriales bacterium]